MLIAFFFVVRILSAYMTLHVIIIYKEKRQTIINKFKTKKQKKTLRGGLSKPKMS